MQTLNNKTTPEMAALTRVISIGSKEALKIVAR